jgi:DHA1 family bicyclomycin/chloramphenicol resistance-like MFS transporter
MTLGARGTMVASCVSFLALGVITAALGPALPELAANTGSSLAGVGAMVAGLYLGSFLGQLTTGALTDRLGRRPVLMATAGLLALGTLG